MSITITIRNTTPYPVHGFLCSDQQPAFYVPYQVAPQGEMRNDETVNSPALQIDATLTLPEGKVTATPYGPAPSSDGWEFKIVESASGKFAVVLDSGASQAALDDARRELARLWPAERPPLSHVARGRMASRLRTDPTAGYPCVPPTLLAIGRNLCPNLSEADAERMADALVKAIMDARFAPTLLSGTHRCEGGQELHWGILIRCEVQPGGKDHIEYRLGVAVER